MVVVEFSITPLVETELRPFVDAAVDEVKKSGLKYEVEAMGTTVEGDLEKVMDVVQRAHMAVKRMGADRVLTEIRIDDRTAGITMQEELEGYRASI